MLIEIHKIEEVNLDYPERTAPYIIKLDSNITRDGVWHDRVHCKWLGCIGDFLAERINVKIVARNAILLTTVFIPEPMMERGNDKFHETLRIKDDLRELPETLASDNILINDIKADVDRNVQRILFVFEEDVKLSSSYYMEDGSIDTVQIEVVGFKHDTDDVANPGLVHRDVVHQFYFHVALFERRPRKVTVEQPRRAETKAERMFRLFGGVSIRRR